MIKTKEMCAFGPNHFITLIIEQTTTNFVLHRVKCFLKIDVSILHTTSDYIHLPFE